MPGPGGVAQRRGFAATSDTIAWITNKKIVKTFTFYGDGHKFTRDKAIEMWRAWHETERDVDPLETLQEADGDTPPEPEPEQKPEEEPETDPEPATGSSSNDTPEPKKASTPKTYGKRAFK